MSTEAPIDWEHVAKFNEAIFKGERRLTQRAMTRALDAETKVERLEAQIADLRAYNERLTLLVDKWHLDAEFNGTACDEQKKRAEKAERERDQARNARDINFSRMEKAEKERDELREALLKARQFIENGIEFGFISLPEDKGDPAHDTLPVIRAVLEAKP